MKLLRKKSVVYSVCILIFVIVILFVSTKKSGYIGGDVFANPRQLGEFVLYGSENNKFFYYEPVMDIINIKKIVKKLHEKIDFMPIKDKTIFDYSRNEIYVVENKGKTNDETYQHVQVQYHNDEGNSMTFSAYEVKDFKNNFEKLKEQYEKQKEDMFGNEVRIMKLNNDMNYIHFKNTSSSSLVNMYYTYHLKEDRISLVNIVGDEVLTYKDGILYHITFNIAISDDVLVEILNTFIK